MREFLARRRSEPIARCHPRVLLRAAGARTGEAATTAARARPSPGAAWKRTRAIRVRDLPGRGCVFVIELRATHPALAR